LRIGQHAVRQHLAKHDTADKRNDDTHKRSEHGCAAGLPHKLEVGLHSGKQEQQQNAELRDRIDHRFLLGGFRKERVLKIGEEQAKQRWSEDQARDQLSHHGRLAKSQHGFAEQTTDHHQHDDLANENCFGCALAALGGPSRPSRQNGQGA
jgi:hypothetical protein